MNYHYRLLLFITNVSRGFCTTVIKTQILVKCNKRIKVALEVYLPILHYIFAMLDLMR